MSVAKCKLQRTSRPSELEVISENSWSRATCVQIRSNATNGSKVPCMPAKLKSVARITIPQKGKQDCQNVTWQVEICKLQLIKSADQSCWSKYWKEVEVKQFAGCSAAPFFWNLSQRVYGKRTNTRTYHCFVYKICQSSTWLVEICKLQWNQRTKVAEANTEKRLK